MILQKFIYSLNLISIVTCISCLATNNEIGGNSSQTCNPLCVNGFACFKGKCVDPLVITQDDRDSSDSNKKDQKQTSLLCVNSTITQSFPADNDSCFGEMQVCEEKGVCALCLKPCIGESYQACDFSEIPGYEAEEVSCTDEKDNDCDGLVDCEEPSCFSASWRCQYPVCLIPEGMDQLYENTEHSCEDGYDNDCDGIKDCADSDCEAFVKCQECKPKESTVYETDFTKDDGWIFGFTDDAWGFASGGTVPSPSTDFYCGQEPYTYCHWSEETPATNWAVKKDIIFKDFTLKGKMKNDDNDATGFVFRFVDRNNFYLYFTTGGGSLPSTGEYPTEVFGESRSALYKISNGVAAELATSSQATKRGVEVSVEIVAIGNNIKITYDNALLFDVNDSTPIEKGLVGVYAYNNEAVSFSYLLVTSQELPNSTETPAWCQ